MDTPHNCEILNFSTSVELDSIAIKILNPEGEGYHEVDLETVFLGEMPKLSLTWGRASPMFSADEGKSVVNIIRYVVTTQEGKSVMFS